MRPCYPFNCYNMIQNKNSAEIQLLAKFFETEPHTLMAFLFGSRAKGMERTESDWDIGVYLKEAYSLEIIDKLWVELANILKRDVDLVVLNEAPPLLASRIAREGFPLVVKDRSVYLDFLIKVTEEAEFFRQFSADYYEIYQRSTSLSEIDKARLKRIIIFLENEMSDFPRFEKMSYAEYQRDIPKRREVERWIENLINSVIDISKIILASEKKVIPDTYQKIVLELSTVPGIEKEVAGTISRWIILRNILAHEYLDIRWTRINDFLKNSESYLKKFLQQAKKLLN